MKSVPWRAAMTALQNRNFRREVASKLLAKAERDGSSESDGVEIIHCGNTFEIRTAR